MNKHIKESLKLYANQLSPMTENSANLWKTLFTLPLHTQKCSLTHESHSTQSTSRHIYFTKYVVQSTHKQHRCLIADIYKVI